MSEPPKALFIKAQAKAKKSGHRHFAVAWIQPKRPETLTPEQRQRIRKQQNLHRQQAKSDMRELQRLLRPFITRYGRKQVIAWVRTLPTPTPRRRGLFDARQAQVKLIAEEVKRLRQAGSRHPLKDIYKSTFIEERQSPEHYDNWRRELRRKRSKLSAGEGE